MVTAAPAVPEYISVDDIPIVEKYVQHRNPVIFVSGFCRTGRFGVVSQAINVLRSHIISKDLWRRGYFSVNNITGTSFFNLGRKVPTSVITIGCNKIMDRCDAVLVINKGWWRSSGIIEEMFHSLEKNLPVFFTMEDLNRWRFADEDTQQGLIRASRRQLIERLISHVRLAQARLQVMEMAKEESGACRHIAS